MLTSSVAQRWARTAGTSMTALSLPTYARLPLCPYLQDTVLTDTHKELAEARW